jgi:hypothetical protein
MCSAKLNSLTLSAVKRTHPEEENTDQVVGWLTVILQRFCEYAG